MPPVLVAVRFCERLRDAKIKIKISSKSSKSSKRQITHSGSPATVHWGSKGLQFGGLGGLGLGVAVAVAVGAGTVVGTAVGVEVGIDVAT